MKLCVRLACGRQVSDQSDNRDPKDGAGSNSAQADAAFDNRLDQQIAE